jgi:hypothetical protein
MEPEVHVIEKYFQYFCKCFTMTNVKCEGNKEIDLLSINPITMERCHVESRISTTFKLRLEATYTKRGTCHRNGLDYFNKEKFEHPAVKKKILELFGNVPYSKVLFIWDTQCGGGTIRRIAKEKYGIEIMDLGAIIAVFKGLKLPSGSRDDVLRIMELVSKLDKEAESFRSGITKKYQRKKS